MNTYYLKRIRRRYKYYWDTPAIEAPILWVLDLKKQEVRPFAAPRNFLIDYVYSHMGLSLGFKYAKRLDKREAKQKFRQHLRNVSPTPHSSPNTTP